MFGWTTMLRSLARRRADPASARRVVRGGSWGDDARVVRAAFRDHYEPSFRYHDLGFRCAEFRAGGRERSECRGARRRVRSNPETATRRAQRRGGGRGNTRIEVATEVKRT